MKARKLPVVIEFYPCELKYLDDIMKRSTKERPITQERTPDHKFVLGITTLEGNHLGTDKDMIIRGVDGECYPCKKTIFKKTYEILD